MTNVEAVLFDYGMVLSGPPDPAARLAMERLLGVDAASFHASYWRHRDAYDRGVLSGRTYWSKVAGDLHSAIDAGVVDALMEADTDLWTQPNLPMIQWAAALQRAGIKTGILSNIGDAMEAGIRGRFPWLADFTHFSFSHRLDMAKPDAAIYRHAAEGLACRPERILFIDDREENIVAARAVGMIGIQYSSHGAFLEEMRSLGLGAMLEPVGASEFPLAGVTEIPEPNLEH
jgi:putative hydrolase of the HAD superfamily